MNYKWYNAAHTGVIRSDGAFIPADPGNFDWQQFIAAGGVADPQDPPDPAAVAEAARQATFDAAIAGDPQLQGLKGMDKAAFDTWWAANVTNAAQAIVVLKKLTWLLIRYVLR